MLKRNSKKKTKRTSPHRKTLPQLVKEADTWYSRYVRLRDSVFTVDGHWVCECITCGRKMVTVDAFGHWNPAVNAGHYIGRACKLLRWDEFNVHAQCARCNAWRDKVDMIEAYTRALDRRYGKGTASDLAVQAHTLYKPTREDLEGIIHTAKHYVTQFLGASDGKVAES